MKRLPVSFCAISSSRDGGGWLEDVALPDGLVAAKLKAEAERIAEGWKWVEVATEFPYASKPKGDGGGQTRRERSCSL
jgi:hypothetical protein